MVVTVKRVIMWSGIILACVVMLLIALYKAFWLLMGTLALDSGLGWTLRLRQPNKTLYAVRCKIVDRQDHCTAF